MQQYVPCQHGLVADNLRNRHHGVCKLVDCDIRDDTVCLFAPRAGIRNLTAYKSRSLSYVVRLGGQEVPVGVGRTILAVRDK
jgi:hypothetical protein